MKKLEKPVAGFVKLSGNIQAGGRRKSDSYKKNV